MVRVKPKTPRKKKVSWLDEIQAEARRPRKSYTPTPTTDAEIMKFITQKAADQRKNRQLEWWEKLASPTKKQWAYANTYHKAEEYARQRGALAQKKKQRRRATRHPPMRKKKKTPAKKQKTCLTLLELAQAFPNIAQQVCFHPKQSTFHSLVGRVPRSKQKVDQWL